MAKAPINVTITGDYNDRDIKKAIRDLESLRKDADQTGKDMEGMGRVGKLATAAIVAGAATAGYAMVQFGKDAIMAASDFEEVQNKVNQVFGPRGRDELNTWAESANTAFGLSKTAALDAASTFGIFGKSAGLTGESLLTFSTDLSQLAGDLASFNNTTVDEALQALGAGLRGESEPLRRFGVLLDDATLKARAMEMGIYDGTGSLTQQQRVLAAQAEILAQTTVQQGDFARTADGLANTMRVLSASVENAKTEIGQGLYFAVNQIIRSMGGSAGLAQTIEDTADSVADLSYGIGGLIRDLYNLGTATADGTSEGQGFLKTIQGLILASPQLRGFVTAAGFVRTYGEATRAAEEAAAAQADSIARLTAGIRGYIPMVQQATRDNFNFVRSTGAATDRLTAQARAYGAEISFMGGTLYEWKNRADEAAASTSGVSSKLTEASEAQRKFDTDLAAGRAEVQRAIDSAKAYATSIQKSFIDALDLGAALEKAKETGKSIVEEFLDQGKRIAAFGENLRKLIAAGLEKPAFDAILRQGTQRGADIAEALAKGNIVENARQVNAVYRSVADLGIEVGQKAAPVFETVGILQAQAMLETMIREFMPAGKKRRQLLSSIEEMVEDGLRSIGRLTNVKVPTLSMAGGGGGGAASAASAMTAVAAVAESPYFNDPHLTDLRNAMDALYGPYPFAEGGIVTGPTVGLVGEAGPEAIIPLRRAGGIGTTINLTVNAGIGTDGAEVGRQIVEALRQYQRRNGPVPISVA